MKSLFVFYFLLVSAASSFAQEEDFAGALPVAEVEPLSLMQILMSGGPVMFPLAGLSIIAVMLILLYLVTMSRSGIVTGRYMDTAEALLRKGDYLGLIAISHRHNEAVARIMRRTLDFVTKNPRAPLSEARDIAATEGTREASRLNQRIVYLADIGAIAPMLGLFGTVLGMIRSFSVVANDIASTRPMLLAEGVSEALVTTAAGLLIGIPAMAAYAFFRGRVQGLIADLEAATTHLMALLSSTYSPEKAARRHPDE
jgi:biopolymer transport protein ExbB